MADYVPITAYVTTPFVFTHVLENWDALFDLYDGEIDAYMRPSTEDLNVTYVWSTRKGNLTLTPATAAATMEFLELPVAGESIIVGETQVTFVSGTPTGNQSQIGASLSGTVTNLVDALNASADPDVSKCVYDRSGNTLIIFYATPGYAGNYLAVGASNLETVILSDDTLRGGGALLTMTSTVYDTQFFIPYGATEAEYVYDVRFENDQGPQAILFGGPMLWKQGVTRFDMSGPMAPSISTPGAANFSALSGSSSTAMQQGPPGPPGPIGPPGPVGPAGPSGAGGAGPIPSTSITDSTSAGRAMLTAADAAAQSTLLGLFSATAKGVVPPSGGGVTSFLRADGTWYPVGSGGGGGGAPMGPEYTTVDDPIFNLSQTWDGSGVVFTGIRSDITNTASAYGSMLIDLQVDGDSRFSVWKDGTVVIGSDGAMLYPYTNNLEVYNGAGTDYAVLTARSFRCGFVASRTTDVAAMLIEDQWENLSVNFTAVSVNIYDTLSAIGSKFLDFKLAGTSQCSITKAGMANIGAATAPGTGGTLFIHCSSTAGLGFYFGTGVPTIVAAKGSIYSRTDGSSTSTRVYVNTDGATAWTNLVSAT